MKKSLKTIIAIIRNISVVLNYSKYYENNSCTNNFLAALINHHIYIVYDNDETDVKLE